jgi:nitrate/nitrite transporter NarK
VAAPLSAPFVGGGVVTFTLPWVLQQAAERGWLWVVAVIALLIAVGCTVGLLLSRPQPQAASESPLVPSPGTPGEG